MPSQLSQQTPRADDRRASPSNNLEAMSSHQRALTLMNYVSAPTGREAIDSVLFGLTEGFLVGDIKQGQKINAARVAEELNVSVVPVREALHILAGQGVVELLPQKGARVKALSPADVEGWAQIFRAITQIALEMAAQAFGENSANEEAMKVALGTLTETAETGTASDFMLAQVNFHRVVNAFGGAGFVDEASRRLQVVFWLKYLTDMAPIDQYRGKVVENYQRLSDAIAAGDAASAAAIFEYHIGFYSALLRGERPDPSRPWVAKNARSQTNV